LIEKKAEQGFGRTRRGKPNPCPAKNPSQGPREEMDPLWLGVNRLVKTYAKGLEKEPARHYLELEPA
jgi:hypothetical protein